MWSSTFHDGAGRPSFNLLQNYGSSKTPLIYYVFDVLVFSGKDMMGEMLETRRALLENRTLPSFDEPIRSSPELKAGSAHSYKIRESPGTGRTDCKSVATVNMSPVNGWARGTRCE